MIWSNIPVDTLAIHYFFLFLRRFSTLSIHLFQPTVLSSLRCPCKAWADKHSVFSLSTWPNHLDPFLWSFSSTFLLVTFLRNYQLTALIKAKIARRWTLTQQRQHGCLHHHILRPAVTLTFNRQNLIRSSVGASEYSLSVLSTVQAALEISC